MTDRKYIYAVCDNDYDTSIAMCAYPNKASAQKIAFEIQQMRGKWQAGSITCEDFDDACKRMYNFEYAPCAWRYTTEVEEIEIRESIL